MENPPLEFGCCFGMPCACRPLLSETNRPRCRPRWLPGRHRSSLAVLFWGVCGIFICSAFSTFILSPVKEWLGFAYLPEKGFQVHSYLCMTTSAASPMVIKFFKLISIKQNFCLKCLWEIICFVAMCHDTMFYFFNFFLGVFQLF